MQSPSEHPQSVSTPLVTIAEVEEWVNTLYNTCQQALTAKDARDQRMFATMVEHPTDKKFLVRMLDESSQIRDNRKLAQRIKQHIKTYGVPQFLNARDRLLFKIYESFGHHFHFVAIPIIKRRLRQDTAHVIIDEARPALTRHLAQRKQEGIGQNVNLLGEVVLGNEEADHRYHHYLEALAEPDINYISVKISGIYAQTHALNYEESFPELCERMATLYRKAMEYRYVDVHGVERYKFVNLDMEEYKDTHLTMRVFMEVLGREEFLHYTAGIVVQAYLPDAWDFQSQLLDFAKGRLARGGAPIKMRIVKGCNLEMERVVASLRGWPCPVRDSKTEADANYLHLLERGLQPENAKALHLGVASHNLYSIAYAYLLSRRLGSQDYMTFEMLEGMANHVWKAQTQLGNKVILYAPVVKDENFLNAVSYLVRRMDETTAPDNFLTYSFSLRPGTKAWDFLHQQFIDAYQLKDHLWHGTKKTQNRQAPYEHKEPATQMANEPDTDFDLPANQQWAESIVEKWRKDATAQPFLIPMRVGAEEAVTDHRTAYRDRSQSHGTLMGEMCQADVDEVKRVLRIASEDPAQWRATTLEERHRIMYKAANRLAEMRGELIGCMAAVTGKTFVEGDVEVSEAVDYARFYTTSMLEMASHTDVTLQPKGTILVISPWNFPCAIPVGGVVAALAGGNTVILKPAAVAAPVADLFAQAFWEAGVPREALQVVITSSREALQTLTTSPLVHHTILTGGTDTAKAIQKVAPTTPLSAETGGKNAIIITASADRDHAIMNVVQSAFGNAGQKCSACSLLLVEASVYDDPDFAHKLRDAATSLKVGGVWDLGNVVGPMITNNNDKLLRAMQLEDGESWLVSPRFVDEQHFILAPTVKWGVRPGSYTFQTELFGPLLAVVRIANLQEGIQLVNSLPYGLTSGLQSLDENEIKLWRNSIQAGNLYINRGITGAIVHRQPFGGMKQSAFGGGVKAGGPNYAACFVRISDKVQEEGTHFVKDYVSKARDLLVERDTQVHVGEKNSLRYLPLQRGMVLRLKTNEETELALRVVVAAQLCGTPLTVSLETDDKRQKADFSLMADHLSFAPINVLHQSQDEFLNTMHQYERIRTLSPDIPHEWYERAASLCLYIATAPPVCNGRFELMHYVKEQSITYEYHRYGSIQEKPE